MRTCGWLLAVLASVLVTLAVITSARRAHPGTARPTSVTPVAPDQIAAARERLQRFETAQREATDFAHLPSAHRTHGADPYALASLDADHVLGVLRGASAIVLLDRELRELQRIEVPGGAIAVAVSEHGQCWVGSERSHSLHHFAFDGKLLIDRGELQVPGLLGVRALAAGPLASLYVLDAVRGKLFTVDPQHRANPVRSERVLGHGPLALKRVGSFLIANLLLDHSLLVFRIDGWQLSPRARIRHDGPIWGFDAAAVGQGELLLTLSGVEDHALDRSDGSFGYIDSFAFTYLVPASGPARSSWRLNLSAWNVVTPKAPLLRVDGKEARVFIAGYGSDRAVELSFRVDSDLAPRVVSERFVPGTSAGLRLASGQLAFADPLLDAWLLRGEGAVRDLAPLIRPVVSPAAPRASEEERLGEALFFTTLMAPANSSEGAHSRFSCETCHFEGNVDGRVHFTGRGDVHVVTKPLRGLFNNRPHFSRALDPDLATMSQHEFRVAGLGSGRDPWFELQTVDYPWLVELGDYDSKLGPEALRRALIAFLMRFSHTPNPAVTGRDHYQPQEFRGAQLFRARCAQCHAARLQSDSPNTTLPFEAWEAAIFSEAGPLVWASAEYQRTGVTPYVHESGTRVPSLRRVCFKWPLFTNGSAATLADVVRGARFDDVHFFHAHAPEPPQLSAFTPDEERSLVRFLELL